MPIVEIALTGKANPFWVSEIGGIIGPVIGQAIIPSVIAVINLARLSVQERRPIIARRFERIENVAHVDQRRAFGCSVANEKPPHQVRISRFALCFQKLPNDIRFLKAPSFAQLDRILVAAFHL